MAEPTKKSSAPLITMLVGGFLTLTSAPCVIAMIHDLIVGADNLTGAIVVGVFFSILLAIGLGSFSWGFKRRNDVPITELSADREQRALHAIGVRGGEVTVAQLAMSTDLSVKEATEFLADLERQGVAHSWVTSEGAISFRIPHLTGKHDAISATDAQYVFDSQVEEQSAEEKARVAD